MSDVYAVVGNPIAHSLSPQIHQRFASQLGESIEYRRILSERERFSETLDRFFSAGGKGLNITLPFKETARHWTQWCSEEARLAGAVNTINVEESGFRGYNTDGLGLLYDLTRNLGLELKGRNTLILGAGGAVRGILAPLIDAGARISIANRTIAKAQLLVDDMVAARIVDSRNISVLGLEACAGDYDLVINATSADSKGQLIKPENVCRGAYCYDLFYQLGGPTQFCQYARHEGACEVSDGLGMLVEQAAEAYRIWRGRRPETESVVGYLRAHDP